jgi:hypothetical protein
MSSPSNLLSKLNGQNSPGRPGAHASAPCCSLRMFAYRWASVEPFEDVPDRESVAMRSTGGVPCSSWCDLWARLQAAGVCPAVCRKCLHKCAWSAKPHSSAMSLKGESVVNMYCAASSTRRRTTKE